MVKDFDNVAFRQIMIIAVSEHFLHTKPSIDYRFIFMLRIGSDFPEESFEKSWGKETANKSGSKFIPRLVLVLPSNWFPMMRVKWLPLMANSFAVSGMVIAKPELEAITRSTAHMGSSSIGI
ncbi:hypothetical protein Tco_0068854 [Tanacetum coccineum]